MAVYKKVNENIKSIFDYINKKSDLKKLIAYDDNNPLDNPITPEIYDLFETRLFPYMKIFDPDSKAKSCICVYKYDSSKSSRNDIYNRNIYINIDIVCHETLWLLNNGDSRPLLILDEIDTGLPSEQNDSIRGNLVFKDCKYLINNNKYHGYRLIYELTNFSKNCENK